MSSIIRRRNGLMVLSVMGYSCLNRGCYPRDFQTGRPIPSPRSRQSNAPPCAQRSTARAVSFFGPKADVPLAGKHVRLQLQNGLLHLSKAALPTVRSAVDDRASIALYEQRDAKLL